MEKEIYKIIVISTAHITIDTFCGYLTGGAYPISYVNDDGFGKIVRVTDDDIEEDDYPADLLACMAFAKDNGCDYIRFNGDGNVYEELSLYRW